MAQPLALDYAPHPIEWHVDRTRGLGASDAPVICGVWPYRSPTPIDIYGLKTGELEPTDNDDELLRRGRIWEGAIAEEFALVTGLTPHRRRRAVHYPAWPIAFAHLDRDLGGVPLELKFSTYNRHGWGPSGTDQIPPHVNVQLHHQMICMGADEGYVGAVVGMQFRWYHVDRDERLAEDLLADEHAFWERVERREPPEPDGSDAYRRFLRTRFPHDNGVEDPATPEENLLGLRWLDLHAQAERLERETTEVEDRILSALAERAGIAGSGWRATWKNPKDSIRTDWKGALADLRNEAAFRQDDEGVARVDEATRQHTSLSPGVRRPFIQAQEVES